MLGIKKIFLRRFSWFFLPPLLLGLSLPRTAFGSVSRGCSFVRSPCLQGNALVEIVTNRGAITVELYGDSAPVTAGNFLDLVNKGVYNGTAFHRVINQPVQFVVQGGDPSSKDPTVPISSYGRGSYIDPTTGEARFIPLEIKLKSSKEPRYSSLTTNPIDLLKLELTHKRGSLAMARSQALDSASAQFYIALRQLQELDGRYAVFGRVIDGMEVVDLIRRGDKILNTSLLRFKQP